MGSCMSTQNTVVQTGTKEIRTPKELTVESPLGTINGTQEKTEGTSSPQLSGPLESSASHPDNPIRPRFASYASGASTPECHSDDEGNQSSGESHKSNGSGHNRFERKMSNPKSLTHNVSKLGLDTLIDGNREVGGICQNVVHIEVPFGKPIEEVYDGVHSGPVLGSGISGLVRLVTHKATGLKYAVKVLDLGLVDTEEGLLQLREEIFIMCQLDHPNIVRLEEVYESHSEIYLVQELCLGGELFDRLDEQPDYHYTEAECARLVKQMLCAVRYLHSRGIIHRDLKLENFLFSSTSKDSELKMIDFGLSKHFRYGEEQHEAVGTPYTVAPEVIRGCYDERCDIWAIGVITFLLLSGDPPFGGCGGSESLLQVRSNILSGSFAFKPEDIWKNTSALAKSFITELLKTDPKQRPTAKAAQLHQWLQEWASRERTGNDNALNPNVVKALVNFKEFSDMRKLLCEVLSFTLLPYQIKDLRREFEKMDTDGSGEISLAALKQVLVTNAGAGSLGALTEEEVEDIFNAMRVRKTETRIHWHEFIAAGLSQCQVDDRNLRLAFDRLDSDHKGYIVLDDIIDLMGCDGMHSEEAMIRMWGDGVQSVKCQHARVHYDDFLLLMKGQTKDNDCESSKAHISTIGTLETVTEGVDFSVNESSTQLDNPLRDGSIAAIGEIPVTADGSSDLAASFKESPKMSILASPVKKSYLLNDLDFDAPLSMDEDLDMFHSGPLRGSSLTPPRSPERGAYDYVTPGCNRLVIDFGAQGTQGMDLSLPKLPVAAANLAKPGMYTRGRSRSLDEAEKKEESKALHAVADVVRDMLLPETDHVHVHKQLTDVVKDGTKSALVVNRKLYRAHRQMRLAVLDASKRFEEQQTEHARQIIMAVREAEGNHDQGMGSMQAGLVMRHGHKRQVSSKSIRIVLEENRAQEAAFVEQANRRGGRGSSRKKTRSCLTEMLQCSMGQDDLTKIAIKAAESDIPEMSTVLSGESIPEEVPSETITITAERLPSLPDLHPGEGTLRGATVPGEFRKTMDPFRSGGMYGSNPVWQ